MEFIISSLLLIVLFDFGASLECYVCHEEIYATCGQADLESIEIHQCSDKALGCFEFAVDPTSGTIMNADPNYSRGCIEPVKVGLQQVRTIDDFCDNTRTPGQQKSRWECTVCNEDRCNGNKLDEIPPPVEWAEIKLWKEKS